MVAKDQALELQVDEQSLIQIEHFVDHLCDILKINDAYFGNILMSMTEFFSLLVELNRQKTVNISYSTDYQRLTIGFRPVDDKTIDALKTDVDLTNVIDSELNKRIFILNKLVDNIITDESETVSLIFDISALHSLVYDDRKHKLQAFYRKKEKKKVTGTHD
jgi:hypothetical protein